MQNYNAAGTFLFYDKLLKILSTMKSAFYHSERRQVASCTSLFQLLHNFS